MATEDEPRLTSLFEACLDVFTAASGKKRLITKIKMARAANDSFKDNRRLFICRLHAAVLSLQKKKKERVESFEKVLDYQPMAL